MLTKFTSICRSLNMYTFCLFLEKNKEKNVKLHIIVVFLSQKANLVLNWFMF